MPLASDNTDSASRRAAVAVWVSGAVVLLISACGLASMAAMIATPAGELRQLDEAGQVPAETWAELEQLRPFLPTAAALLGGLVTLPALALIALGFGVRRGHPTAMRAASILLWVMLSFVGLNLVLSLPAALSGGVLNLLPILAVSGLLWWCIRVLRQAKAAGATDTTQARLDLDPWETSR
jgi:hypothetical protein